MPISHKQVIGVAYAVHNRMRIPIDETDSYLSYLPASHSFEQAVFCICLAYGMKCGFYSGDPRKIMEDLTVLKPTIFPSVPRLYNKVFAGIKKKFSSGAVGCLARRAVDVKMQYLRDG